MENNQEKIDISKYAVGDIFHLNPTHPYFPALIVATEIREFGVQGYICPMYEIPDLVRFKGLAYGRYKWIDLEFVGHSPYEIRITEAADEET